MSALVRRDDADKPTTAAQAVHYARLGTTAAKAATSLGFFTLEAGTHVSFSLARTVTTGTVTSLTRKVEDAVVGRDIRTRVPLNYIIRKYFDAAETISLIPISIGQKVARTSINVASSSIELGARVLNVPAEDLEGYTGHLNVSVTNPGDAESNSVYGPLFGNGSANFAASIPALIRILEREWHSPRINAEHLPSTPDETYSGVQILYALTAWSGIQKITRLHHQKKWLANMKEIPDWEWRGLPNPATPAPTPGVRSRADTIGRHQARSRRNTGRSRPTSVHVVSDYHLPDHSGEILTAEIGAPATMNAYQQWSAHRISQASFSRYSTFSLDASSVVEEQPQKVPYPDVRRALKRFSRMVLGGYGGAGVLLFGVKLPSIVKEGRITASINEAGDGFRVQYSTPAEPPTPRPAAQGLGLEHPVDHHNHTEEAEGSRTPLLLVTDENAGTATPMQSSFSVDLRIPRLPRQLAELVGTSPAPEDHPLPPSSSSSTPTNNPNTNSIPFPSASSSTAKPPPSTTTEHGWDERSILEDVMESAENSSDSESEDDWEVLSAAPSEAAPDYFTPQNEMRFWNLVRGLHDKEIFHAMATAASEAGGNSPVQSLANLPGMVRREFIRKREEREKERERARARPPVTTAGDAPMLPRFWALTDHGRQQVVLVLRGTMTLNEVAIDLACDTTPFRPSWASPSSDDPGPSYSSSKSSTHNLDEFWVHQGMYGLAQLMGAPGKPVQQVVANALAQNEGYELILCGHSLGAGVCALLGLMWGDPQTCLTVESSGLPEGRPISVFCFAPPCVMSPTLARTASSYITSFIWSHDVVSRLSLGGVRDLKAVTSWLLHAERFGREHEEHVRNILRRIARLELMEWLSPGSIEQGDEDWFLSLRKTLEANMRHTDLFPPGRIFWAMRDDSFHPSLQSPNTTTGAQDKDKDKLRVFEVENPERVFDQVIFSMDMLSAHFVQNYDKYLRDYL